MNIKVISIVGANSFVGQHLTRLLLQDSSIELKILSHSDTSQSGQTSEEHIQYFKGDLLDATSLNAFAHEADVLINLAYLRNGSIEENVDAVKNLYDIAIRHGIKRFIHCSTAVVVGRAKETFITEKSICFPKSSYEKSKYKIEKMLLANDSDICETTILRPTAVFGLNGENIIKILNDIRYGNELISYIKYFVYGYRKLNLVPVENVVEAIRFLAFCNQELNNEVFIVSSDDSNNNNYRYIANLILGKIDKLSGLPSKKYLHMAVLKLALLCSARSSIEPMTTYSSEKLCSLGYVPPKYFDVAIEEFIKCQLSCSS